MVKRLVLFGLILIAVIVIGGCSKNKDPAVLPSEPMTFSPNEPLMATVSSLEEAEELASLYEIELVNYGYRVATFYAEDPVAVVQKGEAHNWPSLSLNTTQAAFSDTN